MRKLALDYFKMEILTPDKLYPARDVLSVDIPADEGRLTVLAHHHPMFCCVHAGKAKIVNADGNEEIWTVAPGMLTVERTLVSLVVENAASVY